MNANLEKQTRTLKENLVRQLRTLTGYIAVIGAEELEQTRQKELLKATIAYCDSLLQPFIQEGESE